MFDGLLVPVSVAGSEQDGAIVLDLDSEVFGLKASVYVAAMGSDNELPTRVPTLSISVENQVFSCISLAMATKLGVAWASDQVVAFKNLWHRPLIS